MSQLREAIASPPSLTADVGLEILSCLTVDIGYNATMSSVQEIEKAVSNLSREDLSIFRDWFSDFDAAAWDDQFERDVKAGHLDALADEAIRDFRAGRCTDL